MRKNLIVIAAVVVAGFLISSCERETLSESSAVNNSDDSSFIPSAPSSLSSAMANIVEAGMDPNSAAFALAKMLVDESGFDFNGVFSPLSIEIAMGMLYPAVNSELGTQMREAFYWGNADAQTVGLVYAGVITALSSLTDVVVDIANVIWLDESISEECLNDEFVNILSSCYSAPVSFLNMKGDPQGAADAINSWTAERTRGMIQHVVDSSSIGAPDRVSILENVVYFKGVWQVEFNPDNTQPRPFYRSDGSVINASMMYQKEEFFWGTGPDGEVILKLPYGSGSMSMYVVLPPEGMNARDFVKVLDTPRWNEWRNSLKKQEVEVFLPKFEIASRNLQLVKAFETDMGIEFSRLPLTKFYDCATIGNFYVDMIGHIARIRVDEEGTEAAAVTVIGNVLSSIQTTPVIEFNRPFLFFVAEESTGIILFMGWVEDPSAG